MKRELPATDTRRRASGRCRQMACRAEILWIGSFPYDPPSPCPDCPEIGARAYSTTDGEQVRVTWRQCRRCHSSRQILRPHAETCLFTNREPASV